MLWFDLSFNLCISRLTTATRSNSLAVATNPNWTYPTSKKDGNEKSWIVPAFRQLAPWNYSTFALLETSSLVNTIFFIKTTNYDKRIYDAIINQWRQIRHVDIRTCKDDLNSLRVTHRKEYHQMVRLSTKTPVYCRRPCLKAFRAVSNVVLSINK